MPPCEKAEGSEEVGRGNYPKALSLNYYTNFEENVTGSRWAFSLGPLKATEVWPWLINEEQKLFGNSDIFIHPRESQEEGKNPKFLLV